MSKRFTDRIAIVTGGGSGIGRALCRRLSREGATVIVADRDTDAAERTASEIGGHAHGVDTAQPDQVETLVLDTVKRFGALHHMVNNAGIVGQLGPLESLPPAAWHAVMGVNLNGVYYGLRHALPAIERAGGGSALNVASIVGCVGFPNAAPYVSAKHGVVGLTRVAGLEYARRGVRVNAIGPSFTATPLLDRHFDQPTLDAIAETHPMGRFGTVAEIAALGCFLLSDEAGFITGSYHVADGGYSAQ